MPEEITFLGALIDNRPTEAKVKDFNIAEAVGSPASVQWKEKKESEFRRFLEQNQDGSFSCVAQTIKKLCGINLFLKEGKYLEFSATPIYQARSNRPDGGMIGVEAFDIWRRDGVTLEALVPSYKMDDPQMDSYKIEQYERDIGKIFAVSGHLGIGIGDFETVASVIQQTGKGVMVWFYFNSKEWGQKYPQVIDKKLNLYGEKTIRHSVTAVDFGLIKGKKYIKIEDSAPFGNITERWISEEFFVARNFFARYPMNLKFQDGDTMPSKPKYNFTKPLEFIPLDEKGNILNLGLHEAQKTDVVALQDILKYESFFPTNTESTGYYGAITAKAVYAFQNKYQVAPVPELDAIVPKGGRVGTKTLSKLNELYSK